MLDEELQNIEKEITEQNKTINYQNTLEDLLYGVATVVEVCHDNTIKNSELYQLGEKLEYLLHRVLLTTVDANGNKIDLGLTPKDFYYIENEKVDLNIEE